MHKRTLIRAFIVIAFAFSIGAIRPAVAADAAAVEAARKEGEVIWYTTLVVDQAVRPIAEAFEKRYPGVKVRFSRSQGPETTLKLLQEQRAGRVHVDVADVTLAGVIAIPDDMMSEFAGTLAGPIPQEDRIPGGRWVPINQYYSTTSINTNLVKDTEAPRSYADLLDPKWRGRMVWHSTLDVSGPPGFIGNILLTMGESAGMDYLRKLAQQKIAVLPTSQRGVLDQVIAGQYAIALMSVSHHAVISGSQGAPVRWLKTEPLIGTRSYVGLVAKPPHPAAGRLLVEFILSDAGQNVLRQANYIPASRNVAALTPTLKPDAGNFKARVMTPEIAKQGLSRWIAIFKELFQ